ncbi:MAG: protein-L-isoaspartate(D-aspartate) O-methyltransferase [Wenzhouxiangella sp.]|nr:protein-L-isoaspartate(D-aspartate) O-methyltransferase [Wenzhouxiangella sp.]MDR9453354.1 protein-L-isoaspartate(D-aspartate) O-methyltransferase [Wenzhouxiangella sp.]
MAAHSVTSSLGSGMTSDTTRARLIDRLRAQGIRDERVLEAMAGVPRHAFVDEALSSRAYENSALPIGRGQTISQPYIVALMTEAVCADTLPNKVLEIGTGSGYQAAVLAQLVGQVFTTERIGELCRLAKQRFHRAGLHNIWARHQDGLGGWPSQAPFDAIVVTAGGPLPEALFAQLAEGGVLVAPEQVGEHQELVCIRRVQGQWQRRVLGEVSFVPLVEGVA